MEMNENRNGESSERDTDDNGREQTVKEKSACSKQVKSDSSDSKSEHEHSKSHREGRKDREDLKKEKDRRRHHRRRRSRSHSRHRHKRSRHHGSHKSKHRHHRDSSSRHAAPKHRRRRSRSNTRSRSRSRTPSPPRTIERREESPRIKREDKTLRVKAMEERMRMLREQAEQMTGVEVPKYYNPTAVNPLKVAEIEKKKKLLWGKKEKVPETKIAEPEAFQTHGESVWASAQFSDNSCQEKFRKLMGMKGEMHTPKGDTVNKQTELFNNLDKEYALARMSTHTHRGVGLGFASYVCDSSKKND